MTVETNHSIKYYCAVFVAVMALAITGCDSSSLCNNGPDNAIHTLGGTGVICTFTAGSDDDTAIYSMIMSQPDSYLRWKTTSGDFGIIGLTCLGIYWQTTFGDNWQPVVIWAGSGTPVCGEIRSLKILFGVVTAEFRLKRADGTGLAIAASLVLALGRECPTGACSGKLLKSTCLTPYVNFDNATNYAS